MQISCFVSKLLKFPFQAHLESSKRFAQTFQKLLTIENRVSNLLLSLIEAHIRNESLRVLLFAESLYHIMWDLRHSRNIYSLIEKRILRSNIC